MSGLFLRVCVSVRTSSVGLQADALVALTPVAALVIVELTKSFVSWRYSCCRTDHQKMLRWILNE